MTDDQYVEDGILDLETMLKSRECARCHHQVVMHAGRNMLCCEPDCPCEMYPDLTPETRI